MFLAGQEHTPNNAGLFFAVRCDFHEPHGNLITSLRDGLVTEPALQGGTFLQSTNGRPKSRLDGFRVTSADTTCRISVAHAASETEQAVFFTAFHYNRDT